MGRGLSKRCDPYDKHGSGQMLGAALPLLFFPSPRSLLRFLKASDKQQELGQLKC